MRKLFATLLAVVMAAALVVFCSCQTDNPATSSSSTPEPAPAVYVTVTFVQEGQSDVVRKVEKGTALTDIPDPAPVKGYTVKWEEKSYDAVESDMVVNAVITANTYTITFDYGDSGFTGPLTLTVTYDSEFELPVNKSTSVSFKDVSWKIADTDEELVEGKYTIDKDITVKIVYTEKDVFVEV